MTIIEVDTPEDWIMPRARSMLIEHDDCEREFLDAYNSQTLHHAWLLCGPRGIGKATFAYRAAKFLFAEKLADTQSQGFLEDNETHEKAYSLRIEENHPSVRQVTVGSHPDLTVLSKRLNPNTKKPTTTIPVDDVRKAIASLASTSATGGWRVVIIDAIDDMAGPSANALLKTLEEPPKRTVFFCISHAPGRLLPTIRSRCRRLDFAPLSPEPIASFLHKERDVKTDIAHTLAELSGGSMRRAMWLADEDGISLYRMLSDILSHVPTIDGLKAHNLADEVLSQGDESFVLLFELIFDWLSRRVRGENEPISSNQPVAEFSEHHWATLWQFINEHYNATRQLNLDKKGAILTCLLAFKNTPAISVV
jgi:DNA polymerase-3 subunit delta'